MRKLSGQEMEPLVRRAGGPVRTRTVLLLTASLAFALTPLGWGRDDAAHRAPRASPQADAGAEEAYLAENGAAMERMMSAMSVKPTGDVDRDFVAMMVPHHQGAIDMATAVLRYGRNEQIRRLAQEIVVTQQQEIAAMELAVGNPLPPPLPAPTRPVRRPTAGDDPSAASSRRR